MDGGRSVVVVSVNEMDMGDTSCVPFPYHPNPKNFGLGEY